MKKHVTLWIDSDLIDKVKEHMKQTGATQTWIICKAIENYLKQKV